MSRLLISGTHSGCGKTTVTCALLAALKARGIKTAAFKCGPDYIDPMFHREAAQIKAYSLDPFFLNGGGLRSRLFSQDGKFSVIEGAMGYYDGITNTSEASAYTAAKKTQTPVVLVLNAKGAGNSIAAVIEGFVRHMPNNQIKGVIFNGANGSRYPDLKHLAENAGVSAYGHMPFNEKWSIPARHLGLLKAGELKNLQEILSELSKQAEQTLDIDGLIKLGNSAPALKADIPAKKINRAGKKIRLAVTRDDAFCFHYEENMELLQALGCEAVFFSPLRDKALPSGISGLSITGGYPELHAASLSANHLMLKEIRSAVTCALPTIAEGGGFMYLHKTIDGFPMCGVIPASVYKTDKLQRFGYITITAREDNLLCKAGESIRSREFHYWDSDNCGNGFTARKAGRDTIYPCVHTSASLYAGFPHLYFPANPLFAENFIRKMTLFSEKEILNG
ncbi:MAG: cobyrinate a,c-diamide synthase [Clostridiales bacterium]|jgi:cobyrinic acid a,c-diamide synthase|nr:cobyrinate a,c-diamide synthase [Clostridiales bacterium]